MSPAWVNVSVDKLWMGCGHRYINARYISGQVWHYVYDAGECELKSFIIPRMAVNVLCMSLPFSKCTSGCHHLSYQPCSMTCPWFDLHADHPHLEIMKWGFKIDQNQKELHLWLICSFIGAFCGHYRNQPNLQKAARKTVTPVAGRMLELKIQKR